MLKMHTLAKWMYGFLEPERPYGLPEDVYNDVIPSGIHNYNRNELFLQLQYKPPLSRILCRGRTCPARSLSTSNRLPYTARPGMPGPYRAVSPKTFTCFFRQNTVFYTKYIMPFKRSDL